MLPVYFSIEHRVWLAAFILTLTLTGNAEGAELEVLTRNVTVTEGDDATLQCNFTRATSQVIIITSVYWKNSDGELHTFMPDHTLMHGNDDEDIDTMKGRGHFEYKNTNGSGTTILTIRRTTKSDADQYKCSIDLFGMTGKTKELYLSVDPRPTTTPGALTSTLSEPDTSPETGALTSTLSEPDTSPETDSWPQERIILVVCIAAAVVCLLITIAGIWICTRRRHKQTSINTATEEIEIEACKSSVKFSRVEFSRGTRAITDEAELTSLVLNKTTKIEMK